MEIFCLHGLPADIVSDHEVQFVFKFWEVLYKSLKITLDFSSGYHPQSNGQMELMN